MALHRHFLRVAQKYSFFSLVAANDFDETDVPVSHQIGNGIGSESHGNDLEINHNTNSTPGISIDTIHSKSASKGIGHETIIPVKVASNRLTKGSNSVPAIRNGRKSKRKGPFTCEICQYSSPLKSNLVVHMLTHTNQRHPCDDVHQI